MPSHQHSAASQGGSYGLPSGSFYNAQFDSGATGLQGGGAAHNNMQPYECENSIVRIA
jgi:microcystin-dependent protein